MPFNQELAARESLQELPIANNAGWYVRQSQRIPEAHLIAREHGSAQRLFKWLYDSDRAHLIAPEEDSFDLFRDIR